MRVSYHSASGHDVEGTVRNGSFALMLGGGASVITCDAEGRPWTIWSRDHTLRRGYSGRALDVWKDAHGVRHYRDVSRAEWAEAWEPVRRELADDLAGPLSARADLASLAELVDRAAWRTPADLENDARRYQALYGGVGILPPDAYLSVVVQPVMGCPYNRCTFCDFYQNVEFGFRTVEDFATHVDDVLTYLGRALPMRRGVFLADADALSVPDDTFLGYLEVLAARLPGRAVSAFTTPFLGRRRPVDTYRRAGQLGLHRLHLGVESGSPAVLSLLGKPKRTDLTAHLVRRAKEGGLSLGVILMVGAGGAALAGAHVRESVELIGALPLDERDIVYLSPLVLDARDAYLQAAHAAGTEHFDGEGLKAQEEQLRAAFRRPGGPKVATYDIRSFLD